MEKVIKEDILKVLDKTLNCIDEKRTSSVQAISNQVIHNASIFQDNHSTSVALIIYAISKILERTEAIDPEIVKELRKARDALKNDNEDLFNKKLKRVTNLIENQDSDLKDYFRRVIDAAKINKSAKIYDHGISSGRVAEILGRSQWEIVSMLGKTKIPEEYSFKDNMERRLKFARRLFS